MRCERAMRRDFRRFRRSSRRASVTGATSACRHTFTNRCTAVMAVRTSITHRIGTRIDENRRPKQSRMIRSARSIRPPLASSPSDSAFARWYEMIDESAMIANGSIDM